MLFYKPVISEPVRRLLTNLRNQIIRPSVPSHFAEASMKDNQRQANSISPIPESARS